MEAKLTEVMTEPLPETGERTVAFAALDRVLELVKGKRVVAIGPGLSIHPETAELVRAFLNTAKAQIVSMPMESTRLDRIWKCCVILRFRRSSPPILESLPVCSAST